MATKVLAPETEWVTLDEAVEMIREAGLEMGYTRLREWAVDQALFTTHRTGTGRGHRVNLKRDEVRVYIDDNLTGLRRFRVKKGRAK